MKTNRSIGNDGIQHPQHPSLDNLCRSHLNFGSHPQLANEGHGLGNGNGNGNGQGHSYEATEPGAKRVVDSILVIVTAIVASICVSGLLAILVVLHVTVKPISTSAYRRLASQVGAASLIDALALLLPNTRLFLTGDSDVPSPVGTSVLVCNHLMDGDWWAIYMLGRCVGLRGSIKVFLRNEILHLNKHNAERPSATMSSNIRVNPSSSLKLAGPNALIGPRNSNTANNNGPQNSAAPNNNGVAFSTTIGSLNAPSTPARLDCPPDIALFANLLHVFMEFPLLSGEDYILEREDLFQLLRSFAENNGVPAPVHLLLFPEGWSLHNGEDRRSILAKSNEFAKREARPQLRHLLLPRTTGFNASLDSLRESSPVVYDVTIAYSGYDGSVPPHLHLNLASLWDLLRRGFPREIHFRVKRYSMEEVLQDTSWLDKKWAEKDRLLSHFARHQSFPMDNRGFCRHRIFDTRGYSVESSVVSLLRLLLVPCAIPLVLVLSFPILWVVFWIWLIHSTISKIFSGSNGRRAPSSGGRYRHSEDGVSQTSGYAEGDSTSGTPFFPATPFASPSISSWRDMVENRNFDNQ